MIQRSLQLLSCLAAGIMLASCVVNPVTGKRDLGLISESQELQIGQENYLPTQQMQGGEYILDENLARYVNQVGNRLAKVADRKLPYEFVVLNNDTPNAWALPGGKIAINRGLLVELQNEAELAAVLGHEITHAAARHTARTMERAMLLQLGVIAIASAASDTDYAGLAVGAGTVGAQIINSRYGRDAELESDYHGMQYMQRAGYDPRAAINLQQTFVRLSEGRESNWLSGLFASHPPSQERVDHNRQTAGSLGGGGALKQNEYQQAIAGIRRDQPAYDAYHEGLEALKQGDLAAARSKAQTAMQLQPREAKFHSLAGQIALAAKDSATALKHFDQAVQLNPDFFEYRIYRGMLKLDANALAVARSDFEKANTLLPTAIAFEGLGDIAVRQNRISDAIEAYSIAAKSDSDVGRRAQQKLAALQKP